MGRSESLIAMVTPNQARKIKRGRPMPIRLKVRGKRGEERTLYLGMLTIPEEPEVVTEHAIALRAPDIPISPEERYQELLDSIEVELGTSTTSREQLNTFMKDMLGFAFKGVYTPSEFKNTHLTRGQPFAILNTDEAPGEHWLGLYRMEHNKYICYDSFGRTVTRLWGDREQVVVGTEPDAEQKIEESNCGQRSCAWLMVVNEMGWKAGMRI